MREILFRGKFEPLHSWIYGDLAHKGDGGIYIVPEAGRNNEYPVDPDTIGQYTGLIDKNGKKIFEGDIIHLPVFTPEYVIVAFDEGEFYWADTEGEYQSSFYYINHSLQKNQFEVVGNIYDNPELIGGVRQ